MPLTGIGEWAVRLAFGWLWFGRGFVRLFARHFVICQARPVRSVSPVARSRMTTPRQCAIGCTASEWSKYARVARHAEFRRFERRFFRHRYATEFIARALSRP
jgi:hypothetical protein